IPRPSGRKDRLNPLACPFRRHVGKASEFGPLDLLRRDRRQRRARCDVGELADAGAEIGELLAFELRPGDKAYRCGVHRMSVAVELIVKVRPRRQAGGADIADDLSAPDMLAGAHGNTAHVAIAGAKTAAVIELHIIAVSPCTARRGDDAIADGVERCAISATEIDAAVHAAVSEDRVPAHAERRGYAAVRRAHHAATLLPDARGLEPLPSPVLGPF